MEDDPSIPEDEKESDPAAKPSPIKDPDPQAPNPLDRPCGPVRKPLTPDPPMEEDGESRDE